MKGLFVNNSAFTGKRKLLGTWVKPSTPFIDCQAASTERKCFETVDALSFHLPGMLEISILVFIGRLRVAMLPNFIF